VVPSIVVALGYFYELFYMVLFDFKNEPGSLFLMLIVMKILLIVIKWRFIDLHSVNDFLLHVNWWWKISQNKTHMVSCVCVSEVWWLTVTVSVCRCHGGIAAAAWKYFIEVGVVTGGNYNSGEVWLVMYFTLTNLTVLVRFSYSYLNLAQPYIVKYDFELKWI